MLQWNKTKKTPRDISVSACLWLSAERDDEGGDEGEDGGCKTY